jgi:hypothetical protein
VAVVPEVVTVEVGATAEVAVATVVMAEVVVPEATVEMAAAVVTVTVMVREVAALEPAVMAEPEQVVLVVAPEAVLVVTELEQAVMVMVARVAMVMAARAATAMAADRAAVRSHKIRSRSKPGPALIPRPGCSPRSRFSFGPRPRLNPWYKRPMPTDRMKTTQAHKINLPGTEDNRGHRMVPPSISFLDKFRSSRSG